MTSRKPEAVIDMDERSSYVRIGLRGFLSGDKGDASSDGGSDSSPTVPTVPTVPSDPTVPPAKKRRTSSYGSCRSRGPSYSSVDFVGDYEIMVKGASIRPFLAEMFFKDTVTSVKNIIEDRECVPGYWQRLFYKGIYLDDDDKKLSDYNIQDESTLVCRLKCDVGFRVKTLCGKKLSLDMSGSALVRDVKAKIQEQEGIPPEQQLLMFAGKQLEDGSSIVDCKITPCTTIHLSLKGAL